MCPSMKEKQLEWKGVNSASMWHHQNDMPYATPKEDWRRKPRPLSQRNKMHRRQMGAQADFSLGVIRFGRDYTRPLHLERQKVYE
ncbi:hypothetical protein X797_008830 [Metarhizium robertsii]|uniref:Uncharacterized protein n=1 Tax=Metarhizium robertsii TaxID=568076 RepID=A0A014P6E5_9HYPO|nr:hypothetical protein X797_008830 [Metarhizium robertsii]